VRQPARQRSSSSAKVPSSDLGHGAFSATLATIRDVNHLVRLSTLAAALAAVPAVACAQSVPQIDVSAGYMATTDKTAALGAVATLHGTGIALPGIHPQLSFALPFESGGRYAATAEGVAHVPGGPFVGGGVGFGRLDQPLTTGLLYDLIAGTNIAPHVDVIGRYYAGLNHYTGQAIFAGLALRL
jgi:hypothetical protein